MRGGKRQRTHAKLKHRLITSAGNRVGEMLRAPVSHQQTLSLFVTQGLIARLCVTYLCVELQIVVGSHPW